MLLVHDWTGSPTPTSCQQQLGLVLVYFAASLVVDAHLIEVGARVVSINTEVLDFMSRRFTALFHTSLVDLYASLSSLRAAAGFTIRFLITGTLASAAILTMSVATARFPVKAIPFLPRTFR